MQNTTESMTLGSPSGPGAPAPFLPSYLMGDPVAVSVSMSSYVELDVEEFEFHNITDDDSKF